jgi:hypothetical protein
MVLPPVIGKHCQGNIDPSAYACWGNRMPAHEITHTHLSIQPRYLDIRSLQLLFDLWTEVFPISTDEDDYAVPVTPL